MEQEKPFAYHVIGATCDNTLAITQTLADAVRLTAPYDEPDTIGIRAYFPENRNEVVPVENYSEQKLATREEALDFIRERDAKIKDVKERGKASSSILPLWGALRCSAEDTEEKQVEDYIKSSPRVWLPLERIVEL